MAGQTPLVFSGFQVEDEHRSDQHEVKEAVCLQVAQTWPKAVKNPNKQTKKEQTKVEKNGVTFYMQYLK